MKKTKLLNSQISYVVAKMGHTDAIAIGDAGLPIPENVQRIDLALKKGVPSFVEVLQTVLTELQIEEAVVANELEQAGEPSLALSQQITSILQTQSALQKPAKEIKLVKVSHEDFKKTTAFCKAVIRTGETTPYANIILKSGVVF